MARGKRMLLERSTRRSPNKPIEQQRRSWARHLRHLLAELVRQRFLTLPCCWSGSEVVLDAGGGRLKNLKDLWDKAPELVDGIGGEVLVGSGFECEEADAEFVSVESRQGGEE